ncbi:hypothetical protein HY641_03635 [Candidatus Woesearchaeota archaeon]|nr:hypothetical protein [Candidatus Woesearchaeota archaeon]
MVAEVNLPIIIGASLIDGINPCAFGVLIFMLAYLMKVTKDRHVLLINGFTYIFAVFLTYLAAGLLLLPIIQQLGSLSVAFYVILGILIVIAGLLEIKDYFWYGQGLSLQIFPSQAERIKHYVARVGSKKSTAFELGVFVALVELPCTGAVYLAVLAMMSQAGLGAATMAKHVFFLLLYNFIFILPLIGILLGVYQGMSTESFKIWHQKHKGLMRLLTGLLLIAMGAWMLLSVW